tara:strand:- start:263 stop:592 length:330 start_codon:yes stop_codon:yes gene_type:complete
VNKTDSRLKARDQRITDLTKIIMIQENVIKVQNSTLKLTKETADSQIKTFEGLLERNYHSNTRVVNDLLYWKDIAERFYKRLTHEITTNAMKGKKKNEKKKTKRRVKSK